MALIQLSWRRDPKGYRLADRIKNSGDIGLVVRNGDDLGPQSLTQPLDHPALYNRLAKVPPNADGALTFINEHGFLFQDDAKIEGVEEFLTAKRFVEQTLRVISRVKNDVPVLDGEDGEDKGHESARQALREGREALEEMCRRCSDGNLSVRFEKDGSPIIEFIPKNLFHATVMQALLDFGSARNPKKCKRPSCQEWFYYGPGTGKRNTAVYCSRRCEKAHAYERLKEKRRNDE